MKLNLWQKTISVVLVSMMLATAVAAQNPYDKFRNREYSNQGYLSEEDEMKLAGQVHQELLKETKLVTDRNLNQYITSIGNKLAGRSERPNIPWKFFVVDDKSINAFATLGGHVYVHTGLIAATTSEAQLASVIGHEIGHIVGRHGLENVKKQQKFGTLAGIATVAGAILGGQTGAGIGQLAGGLLAGGYLMKHSRDAEREADFLGVHNLERSGYNTGGMVEMFEILNQLSRSQPDLFGSILASHPPASERAANTRREIDDHMRGSDGRGTSNTQQFGRVKGVIPTATQSTTNPNRKVRRRP
ncbi:MAG: M48 family metalloprotease [Acidobacteriota bacterium]|nr:MAG: M48 family metalloprotease [Acidobacteriota bacterium]